MEVLYFFYPKLSDQLRMITENLVLALCLQPPAETDDLEVLLDVPAERK